MLFNFRFNSYFDRFLKTIKDNIIKILFVLFLFVFFYSSVLVFLNYKNLFSKKIFYFYSKNTKMTNIRYLKPKKNFKENLDVLLKDFLLGTNEGLSLGLNSLNTKFLYSFLNNFVYYVNLSKEFYDSFFENDSFGDIKTKIDNFKKSVFETININYPFRINKIVIFIEGHILD